MDIRKYLGIFFIFQIQVNFKNIQKIVYSCIKRRCPRGGGHDNALDPSTSLRMTHCKAVHFGGLSELEATPEQVRGNNAMGYFTKRSMSETEPAMRFLKFQMRAKVLP